MMPFEHPGRRQRAIGKASERFPWLGFVAAIILVAIAVVALSLVGVTK